MSQLIQEISLKDTGYSKGIKSAQAALEKLAKENGVANASFRNTNKEVNSAKRYFSTLSVEYSKLSDQAKKSEFGRAIHRQMEQAQRDLQDMYTATEKVNQKLREMQETARKKVNTQSQGGGDGLFGKSNKLIGGILDKAGLGEVSGALGSLGNIMGGGVTAGAMAATAGVAGLGFALKKTVDVSAEAIQKSAEFGKSMSQLGAITGVSGKGLDSMRKQVMNVGKDTNTAFTSVARNFALVGSALPELLSDADGMEAVSRAAITLSKAGLMPLDDATQSLTDSMAQFGKDSDEAGKVVDILANSSQKGSADIANVAETLRRCGTAANTAGVGLKETAAMTEVLAAKGLKGAEAGTALRNVLLNMSTKGIDDINPKVVGVGKALEALKAHASDATWMVKTFGQEGATAAGILANGVDTYHQLVDALDGVGTAAQMAAQNENNLATQWENTKTQWSNLLSSFNVDGADSPLMVVVQQIQDIISAVDEAFEHIKNSDVFSDVASGWNAEIEAMGQAITHVISIVGDCVKIFMDLVDAGGNMEMMSAGVTAAFKLLENVLFAISAAVHYIGKVVSWATDKFSELKGQLLSKIGDIPMLSKVKSIIESITRLIQTAINKWKELKAFIKEDMAEGKNKPKSKVSKSQNKNDNAKKGDGNSQQGNGGKTKTTFTSKTTKETPSQKYENRNRQIDAKAFFHIFDLEDSINNEKKAIEEKIKATDDYINELTKNETEIRKNQAIVKQLNEKQRAYKDRLKAINVEYADNKTIKDANEAYAEKIEQLNRDRENGWITENEYSSEYIKAMKDLVQKYKSVTNVSDELKKTIDTKTDQINKIELGGKLNDMHASVDSLWEEIHAIRNNEPLPNQNYMKYRDVDNKIHEKLEEATFKKEVYGNSSISGKGKQLGQSDIIDFVNEYAGTKGIYHIASKDDIDTITHIADDTKLTKEQLEAIDRVINTINNDLTDAGNNKKTWENNWLDQYKALVKTYKTYASNYELGVNSLDDAGRLQEARDMVTMAMYDNPSEMDRQILAANAYVDPENAEKQFNYIKKLWQNLVADVEDDEINLNVNPQNLTDLYDTIQSLNPEITANLGIDQESLEKIKDSITSIIDDTATNLLNPSNRIKYNNLTGNSLGDKSNYSISAKSYDRVSRENTFSKPISNIDKYYDKLNKALDKYKETEQKMLEIDALGSDNGLNITSSTYFLEETEAEIKHYHDKIQKNLNFRMAFDGINETMEGLNDIGNVAMMWDNLGESLDNAKNGFERFMTVFQAVISTFQTVGSIIETVNTVVSLFSAISGAATQQKIAEAGANKALETTTLDLAAAQIFAAHASIPFAGPGIASGLIAQMLSTMAATQAATLAMAAYANGGIVGGDSFHGDTTLVRANKGEMVLNNLQQRNLFSLLDGALSQPFGGGSVDFKISGDALYGTLKNHKKIKGKTGHIISL